MRDGSGRPAESNACEGPIGIGEAAARFGLAVSTLRYWEERGLVSPVRRHGTWRRYGADEMHRIGLIQLWRDAGMLSLDEIAAVLAGTDEDHDWRTAVASRLKLVTEQQRRLAAAQDHLEHLLSCPDDHPAERCPYLRRVTSERMAAARVAARVATRTATTGMAPAVTRAAGG